MDKVLWKFIFLLSLFLFNLESSFAQYNILGKPGLVKIPRPTLNEARENISFQLAYLPESYSINNFMGKSSNELFYSVKLNVTNWLLINFVLTRPTDIPRIGIGDRHLDLQLFLLKQEKHVVNLSVILSPPLAASFIDHNSIFISRVFSISETIKLEPILGYGFTSNFRKPPENFNYENSGYQWIPKSEFGNYYLSGVFGGLQANYKEKVFLSAEYDSKFINISSSITLFKRFFINANLMDFNALSGQVGYKVFLDKSLKSNFKSYD
ncbi:MAG: hypothetical protein P8O16_09430 [Algoriphagus sp.]|uniref:hypothetical protein n=1 Tax=Algoriphagus sp. TaxID=1872435 RepID=UPI002604DC56|nr:hypothetical protein [Algoriphagus sp.]MDG1277489.1 hypothetical protein [Algoriphagus sp.]